jgi:3',5'-cyclic AMP phosphodiesterase CpdA
MVQRWRHLVIGLSVACLGTLGFLATRAVTTSPAACAQEAGPDSAIMVIGDFGGGRDQPQVAEAMTSWAESAHPVQAIATTGDNVNPCGEPRDFEAHLVEPYEQIDAPMWATLGNHDVAAGHGAAQLDFLGLPSLPYSKSLDSLQLLFLDSTRVDAAQTEWLEATLAAPGPSLRLVFFHHPAYSCGFNGATPEILEQWVPVLERHAVAAVFSGHDHYYERFRSPGGVSYVVTGGGGMFLLDIGDDCTPGADRVTSERAHHYLYLEAFASTLRVRALGKSGQILDDFRISR